MPSSGDRYSADQLRILHWNIHSWRDASGVSNLTSIVELIRATDPHAVSLVEVDEAWGAISTLDELANRCGYSSVFAPTFEFGHETPAGGFGNALMTKLPILTIRQRQLVWPPRFYDGTEPSEPRSVVLAKLRIASEYIWLGSTHLPREDSAARADALHRLATLTQSLDGPWMVCGDFNVPASFWRDNYHSLTVRPSTPQPTHPASQPVEAIDYCIASPGIVAEAKVLPVSGSDHLPIVVLAQQLTPR